MNSALSALVIHDIKNALALLEIDLEQLDHTPGMPTEVHSAYQRCTELRRRLIGFLTLYKHEQHRLSPNLDEVVLEEFLEDLLAGSLSLMGHSKNGHPVQVRIATERIAISPDVRHKGVARFDTYLLELALESALNNALRYAHSQVELWFEQMTDRVSWHITDDGPGVQAGRGITRRDTADPAAGTGLGLALCQAVAESHGDGTVSLQDAPTQGAHFRLDLPVPA